MTWAHELQPLAIDYERTARIPTMQDRFTIGQQGGGFHRPSEIAQLQRELHAAILQTNRDMQRLRQCMGPQRLGAWMQFMQSWSRWYGAHSSLWERSWGSTVGQLDRWRQQLMQWRQLLERVCAEVARQQQQPVHSGPAPSAPPSLPVPELPKVSSVGLGGWGFPLALGVGLGAFALWRLRR